MKNHRLVRGDVIDFGAGADFDLDPWRRSGQRI